MILNLYVGGIGDDVNAIMFCTYSLYLKNIVLLGGFENPFLVALNVELL